jgi:hypothetical protein
MRLPTVADTARRLVPTWVKRSHERRQTRRFLRAANAINLRYAERHGSLEVRRGPFAGMRYPEELLRDSGDAVAKLAGTYELELHEVMSGWIAAGIEHVVDVGAAEGYYAVGLAHASPATTVLAYDIDDAARERCARLAEVNGVADRVRLGGECTAESLQALPADGVAVLMDCEGCERELLDPEAAPRLRDWPILVELHDFIDPTISPAIFERFAPTHEIDVIEGRSREDLDLTDLDFLTPAERRLALGERRPGPMRWAHLQPRS